MQATELYNISMLEVNLTTAIKKILEEKHLLSANEMLHIFQKQGHAYNKTSVYRALDQLSSENAICRHHFDNDEAKYELREQHHTHLVCTNCKKIETAECTYAVPKEVGSFKADHHHTTVFGTCGNCQ